MRKRSCVLLALALAVTNGFQTAPVRAPFVTSSRTAAPRSAVKAALPPSLNDVAFQLATLPGLGEGYGGKSTFSESASGQTGDLGIVFLLAVVFPTLVTVFIYVDGPWKNSD